MEAAANGYRRRLSVSYETVRRRNFVLRQWPSRGSFCKEDGGRRAFINFDELWSEVGHLICAKRFITTSACSLGTYSWQTRIQPPIHKLNCRRVLCNTEGKIIVPFRRCQQEQSVRLSWTILGHFRHGLFFRRINFTSSPPSELSIYHHPVHNGSTIAFRSGCTRYVDQFFHHHAPNWVIFTHKQ